jgi:hypothetical protein
LKDNIRLQFLFSYYNHPFASLKAQNRMEPFNPGDNSY